MAFKLKDIIQEDVQALIKNLTGFEETQENFKACERFLMSNVIHHRYLSVDGHAVRRSVEGMVTKFHVHGLSDRGQELDSLIKEFLASSDFKDHSTVDIQWCLLSLLLNLGENPTNIMRTLERDLDSSSLFTVEEPDEEFDWAAYLKEGLDDFQRDWGDNPSDEDEVDCMVVPERESIVRPIQPKLPEKRDLPQSKDVLRLLELKDPPPTKPINVVNAQNILAAESWLKSNIQHEWWSKAHFSENIVSKHPFSQTSKLCDPNMKEGIKTSTFSEHKIALEIIWLLSAPCDTAIFMQVISDDGLKVRSCVRPHVTAPSLTQDVFASYMTSVCACADMLEELQSFCFDLNRNYEKKPCKTYEAYRCAIERELRPVLKALSELERKAHQQSATMTLLTLRKELGPSLSTIASLHKLHKSSVLDWKQYPNWLCATHLLSVLLSSLRNGDGNTGTNFRIFVQTFQVYIKIIDQWLSGGHLYDTCDEFFIIRKVKSNSTLGASFEMRDWEKELATFGVESPQALQVLASCLLKAAQPLHVLCELDRLPELRKKTSNRCSLESLFLQNLVSDLEPSQAQHTVLNVEKAGNSTDVWWKKLDNLPCSKVASHENLETSLKATQQNLSVDMKSVIDHLHRIDDPHLKSEFQFFLSLANGASTSKSRQENPERLLFKKLLSVSHNISEYISVECCVERAVLCLSADWEGIAGALAADILIRERQLLHHLHTAQSVFLLQAAYRLQPFLSHIFKLILHRKDLMWMNSHTLSVLLQDCMDSDQFTLLVMTGDKDPTEMNSLECIDALSIHYQMEWPLCAIVGDVSQNVYNFILRLLLKMRWGLWLLEDLDISDLDKSRDGSVSQRLLYLRYWLLHAIRGSFSFLAGHVLNTLWLKFEEDVKNTKDMNSIIQVHNRFLVTASRQCLNARQSDPIKNALYQLVVIAENLHALWRTDLSKIPSNKLDKVEGCYRECHQFLAASLHLLAENDGLEHLVVLSDLFNWKIPEKTA